VCGHADIHYDPKGQFDYELIVLKTMIQARPMVKQVLNRVKTITLFTIVVLTITIVNNPHAKPKLERGYNVI